MQRCANAETHTSPTDRRREGWTDGMHHGLDGWLAGWTDGCMTIGHPQKTIKKSTKKPLSGFSLWMDILVCECFPSSTGGHRRLRHRRRRGDLGVRGGRSGRGRRGGGRPH